MYDVCFQNKYGGEYMSTKKKKKRKKKCKRQIMRQPLKSTPPVMGGAAFGIPPEDYLNTA